MTKPLLRVEDLSLWIVNGRSELPILKELSFEVGQGDRLGVAGESGAGKTMTVRALTGLCPRGGVHMEGSIAYCDKDGTVTDILKLPMEERQRHCAMRTALILQDSMNALNPYEQIGKQWTRVLRLHNHTMTKEEARAHMLKTLPDFGLGGQEELLKKYPHQISGGMKQRLAIAFALESPAKLLVADEPTTALDAINQRRMVEFIRRLCEKRELTLLYISHNLGILKSLCSHIMVMKDGHIVEQGRMEEVFGAPSHSYTRELVNRTKMLMV